MSTTSSSTTTGSASTSQQSIDYLSYLNGLTPVPFNPNTVINALLQADQAPIQNLQTQITNIQTNESIYKSIAADVTALQSSAFNLTLQGSVQANTVSSTNPSAVTASAAPSVQAGTYTVAVGTLATATTAASTAPLSQAIDSRAATTPLNALNLSAVPTGGNFSVIVDGKVQSVFVDPTKALLDPSGALMQLQSAISAALNDGSATVNVGVSGNKVTIGISGAGASHTISFGAAGDTSNFLSVMNLSTVQGSTTNGALTLTSSGNVGVAQANAPLSSAVLATPLNASSGIFSINGVSIAWDASADSLNSVISRINNSAAGVNATYNSTTDQLTVTNKTTGQTAINLADVTGNFLAAMNLAPGTTTAQILGTNASVTVNGTTVSSTSNTITNAVPGLSISAAAKTTDGSPVTLTVGPDTTGITKQVQAFVDAANKLINDITTTQQKDATTGGYSQLLGDPTLLGLKDSVLTMITGRLTTSGPYQSLQDVGITTGSVGSLPGTTSNLTLDSSKLAAAIAANPGQVAALFNGTTQTNGFQGVAQQLNTFLQQESNPVTGPFALYQSSNDAQIKTLQSQIDSMNSMIDQQRQILTTQFTAMSNAMSLLASENMLFSMTNTTSSSSNSGQSG